MEGLKFKIKKFKIICQITGFTSITLLSERNSFKYFLISSQLVESGVPKLIIKTPVLPNYVYSPTLNLVNYVKSLNVPVICFPREIKNYKEFCDIVKPDAVSIDYNVDPKKILKDIKIPIQGGLDPKILLTDYESLKKEVFIYLEIFKDHPYIFNLGHGILPETNPEMLENLIKIVKDFK